MKSEFLIKESIDLKERMIASGKNLAGGILTDGVIHDLKIQVDILKWILKN